MIVIPLQSGSTGNCIFVETRFGSFLFDAGISARCVEERLAVVGKNITDVEALFITHEHSDHIRCAAIYARKFNIPVYITPKTYNRGKKRFQLEGVIGLRHFEAGDTIEFTGITIRSIPTPHDSVDGSVFVISDGKINVGIFTDLGHVFQSLKEVMPTLDGIYIESNYDPEMLKNGTYPAYLKRRITGPGGHISNHDAANLIARYRSDRLQWVCLGHLSEENNSPEKVLTAHRKKLGTELPIGIASRYDLGPIFQTTTDLFNLQPIRHLAGRKPDQRPSGTQLSLF